MLSSRVRSRRQRDEQGVVMAAVLAISIIVVLFSMAAVSQTVDGITQAAIANKQVNSTDAAEAGLQYEVTQLDDAASAGTTTFACAPSTALASSGAFTTTYAMSYATATGATAATTPTSGWSPCTGSIDLTADTTYFFKAFGTTTSQAIGSRTLESAVFVGAGTTYAQSGLFPETLYAGIDVLGAGSFGLTGGNTYSGFLGLCASNWSFGGNYYSAGIQVPALQQADVPGIPTTFDGACSVTGNLYMNNSLGIVITGGSGVGGNVYDAGPTTISAGPPSTNGGRVVGGDVWSDGLVAMTGGASVGGNIYSADPLGGVSLTGGTTVYGSTGIDTTGPVSLLNGPTVKGNIDAGGPVTSTSATIGGNVYGAGAVTLTYGSVGGNVYANGLATLNTTVAGNVYSTGGVTIAGGTYKNIYADGPVTVTGGTVTGTIYTSGGFSLGAAGSVGTVEDEGGTVAYLAKASGPLYETGAVLSVWPLWFGPTPTTAYTTIPTGWPLPYSYSAPAIPAVPTTVSTQMVTAATAASGGSNAGTTTVPFPTLTYSPQAWTDNSAFCGSANPCAVASTQFCATCGAAVYLATNNDCNYTATIAGKSVVDPNSVWQLVLNMEQTGVLPTVIQTDCQFVWGNGPLSAVTATSLPLRNNLAVFDTAGFDFSSSFGGVSSGDGKAHQFYAIVPSTPGVNILPPLGPILAPASYPIGEATCDLVTGPDIVFDAPLTDGKVQDFLYSPANVCSNNGVGTVYGRIYAGEMFDATSNVSITAGTITPWAAQPPGWNGSGGVTGPAAPTVESVGPG